MKNENMKINESKVADAIQDAIEKYYMEDHADSVETISQLTGIDYDLVSATLDISTEEDAMKNLMDNTDFDTRNRKYPINENKISNAIQNAIEGYYNGDGESTDTISELTELDFDIVVKILNNSTPDSAMENLMKRNIPQHENNHIMSFDKMFEKVEKVENVENTPMGVYKFASRKIKKLEEDVKKLKEDIKTIKNTK